MTHPDVAVTLGPEEIEDHDHELSKCVNVDLSLAHYVETSNSLTTKTL